MAGPDTLIPPTLKPTDLAAFKILIEGLPMPDKYEVLSFSVKRSVNKIPSAQLVIRDGDVAKQKYEASTSDDFVPGKMVTIQLGYNANEYKNIFKGVLVSQSIKLRTEQTTQLVLEMKDVAVKMTVGRKNKFFFEKNDQGILEEILNGYAGKGITKKVNSSKTPVTHEEMVQYFCTDWDFMVSRADAIGQLVFVKDGEITIDTPKLSGDKKINLSFGENVYNFEAQMDARDEYEEIIAKS